MKTAVVYIAGGQSYCQDSEESCASIKRHNPDLPCILATDSHSGIPGIFDRVIHMPNRQYPQNLWYVDSVRYCCNAYEELAGEFDSLLFLDTDTYCDSPLDDMLRLAERFDICVSHGVTRQTTGSVSKCPEAFPEFEVGVMLIRAGRKIQDLFRDWLDLYQNHIEVYGNNDQGPLRDALWLRPDISMYVLAEEYHARWGFGVCVVSKVKILHSRSPGYPNSQAAKEINSTGGRRLFRPGGTWWRPVIGEGKG